MYNRGVAEPWERDLDRWVAASLLDPATADRIRAYEREQSHGSGLRWPVLLAIALGVVTLGAGVLLFVSAHWDELSPAARMALVITLVAGFHLGGAFTADRFPNLSVGLHALGTVCLGAGIALTGQIFHLSAHWPGGILLWAIGAALAWWVLRHWPQYAITAVLVPAWLVGEWDFAYHSDGIALVFLFVTAMAYLTSRQPALGWIGGFALLPLGAILWAERRHHQPEWGLFFLVLPLGLSFVLRSRAAIWNLAFAAWAVSVLYTYDEILLYPSFAIASIGLIAWGVAEQHTARINIGIAAFAITVMAFYFSHVMDKLGRSASLIALGCLFLGGGWLLERTRRRLVARVHA